MRLHMAGLDLSSAISSRPSRTGFKRRRTVEVAVIVAAIAFTAYRVSLYWKHRVYRIVPRIQVAELAAKLKTQYLEKILLADVRSHGYYDPGARRIRGSIRLEPHNLTEEVKTLPKDKDIYLYCT